MTTSSTSSETTDSPLLYAEKKSRGVGFEFVAAIAGGMGLSLGAALGISALIALIVHGLDPISQICECPENRLDFGPGEAYWYGDCNDNTTQWFQTKNDSPPNTNFTADGWFYGVEWSRATYRSKIRVTGQDVSVVPFVYECAVFHPFWKSPIDYVGFAMTLGFILLAGISAGNGTVSKTQVFSDRIEITWFNGARTVVPIYALQGEPTKHEIAGIPPAREDALVLKTTEKVVIPKSGRGGVSTRLKSGKCHKVRAEPRDNEAFLAAIATAREGKPEAFEHFFQSEIPTSGEDDVELEGSYAGNHRVGFWIRVLPVLGAYWAVLNFGFTLFLFLVKELIQPGRPKPEDAFRSEVLVVRSEGWAFLGAVVIFGGIGFYNSVPSRVAVFGKHLSAVLDRGRCLDAEPLHVVVPKTDVVSTSTQAPDAFEAFIRYFFEEPGGVIIKARKYFVTREKKKCFVVTKHEAKDPKVGIEVKAGEKSPFYPPNKDAFISALSAEDLQNIEP